jgi:Trp operon repressor
MSPSIETQPTLSDAEWSLVVELLEREQNHLPIEIHHTTTRSFRDQLKKRLEIVESLLTRLNPSTK